VANTTYSNSTAGVIPSYRPTAPEEIVTNA